MRKIPYRHYVLALLTALYAFNLMDLSAMQMAMQSIKVALHLSDTELGFIGGLAFFLFYAAFGVPMGRWADRGDRALILSLTRVLWSLFVLLTGRVTSFLQLLLIRMGVAVGESGCLPPAYSLISDYFSREERPQALGLFFLSSPLAALFGTFSAGWLIELYGWRTMFTLMALPGVVLAPLAWFSLREPRRRRPRSDFDVFQGHTPQPIPAVDAPPPLLVVLRRLYSNSTYRNLLLALVVNFFYYSGILQWQAAFFIRSYGLTTGALGMWLAVVWGAAGMIGSATGGIIASRWAPGNERLHLLACAALNCGNGVLMPLVFLTRNYVVAFALLAVTTAAISLTNGPLYAAMQSVVPSRLRAMSVVIAFFCANLIGAGLGPLVVGVVSDHLRPIYGGNSLRYALLVMSPWFFLVAWYMRRASKSVMPDIKMLTEYDESGVGCVAQAS